MPIDPDAVARSVASLADLGATGGELDDALNEVARETSRMFEVDGAGLMLLAEGEVLRYVAASDERGQVMEILQEQVGEGPCLDAFELGEPVVSEDVATDPRWPQFGPRAGEHGIHGVLGVPVQLDGGAVGMLNVYSSSPRQWDDGDVESSGSDAGGPKGSSSRSPAGTDV